MSGMGVSHANICTIFNLSHKTLLKYYKRELETGLIEANAKVANSLFSMATSGEPKAVAAAIFWLKCRAGWKEPAERLGDDEEIAPTKIVFTSVDASVPKQAAE